MPRRSGSESGRSAIHHDLEQRDLALREVEDLGRAQPSAVCHAHEDRNRHALANLTLRAVLLDDTPISSLAFQKWLAPFSPCNRVAELDIGQ